MNPPADEDKGGKKSDHRIVVAKLINIINNKSGRETKQIKVRPFPQSGMTKMKEWFVNQTWDKVYESETAHEKAAVFQQMLLNALDEIFPEKIRKINSDDQPWISQRTTI